MSDAVETNTSKSATRKARKGGLTSDVVNNAIKLLTSAKQLGVQSFLIGDFHANFANNQPDRQGVYPSEGKAPVDDESWFEGLVGPK